LPKNLLSYHIKALKNLSLIEEVHCGRNINYKIKAEEKARVGQILGLFGLIKRGE
jgi:predicted transcriptional regulator